MDNPEGLLVAHETYPVANPKAGSEGKSRCARCWQKRAVRLSVYIGVPAFILAISVLIVVIVLTSASSKKAEGDIFYKTKGMKEITRNSFENEKDCSVLILSSEVISISHDALLDMKSLKAIIVEQGSTAKPESCDFGTDGNTYRHVHVFYLMNDESIFLPYGSSDIFTSNIDIPIVTIGEGKLSVSDAQISEHCNEESLCLNWVTCKATQQGSTHVASFKGASRTFTVMAWNGTISGYGVSTESSTYASFMNGTLTIPYGVYSLGNQIYNDNESIGTAILPSTLKELVNSNGKGPFQGSSLSRVEIFEGLRVIANGSFNSTKIENITIPVTVTSIGINPFLGTKLSSIVVEPESMFKTHQGKELYYTKNDNEVELIACACYNIGTYTIPEQITVIGSFAMSGYAGFTGVNFGTRVKTIDTFAFNKSQLENIVLPSSLTTIGTKAFNYSEALKTITFEAGQAVIDSYAFNYCTSLKSVNIKGANSIGNNAFNYCDKLESVTLGNNLATISDYAFNYCSSLRIIDVPEGVSEMQGNFVFNHCSSLEFLKIPNSMWGRNNYGFGSLTLNGSSVTSVIFAKTGSGTCNPNNLPSKIGGKTVTVTCEES